MEIIRISILGIAGILLAILLKEIRPEYSGYILITTSIFILFFSVGKLSYIISSWEKIQKVFPIDSMYISILIKMIGITYVGQFASGLCQDAGYKSVAGQIEIFGRLAVMAVSMPVLSALLETIYEFLG